ncbi:unnamed protein product [Vitrella brassicaformis CCMP3155]|uniref:Uncharacterized protein n=1 Tax=Vitrella brassicaformis (strain CCMP3155) TaxID=1169540 RepID=A0A0G4EA17_VITBC|nr:unnamed protein product [Vitrella brassicaformis CCMP3155]|eukprot:CEL92061.1 unnamed protein product [Vitrella brassicaformis CCMP3155]
MWRVGDAMPTFREIHWSRDDHKSKRELHQFYELYYYAHDKHEIGVGSYPRIPEAKTDYETIKACSYRNVRVDKLKRSDRVKRSAAAAPPAAAAASASAAAAAAAAPAPPPPPPFPPLRPFPPPPLPGVYAKQPGAPAAAADDADADDSSPSRKRGLATAGEPAAGAADAEEGGGGGHAVAAGAAKKLRRVGKGQGDPNSIEGLQREVERLRLEVQQNLHHCRQKKKERRVPGKTEESHRYV